MADTRYLKLKKGRWWFQIAVPLDLQERLGKKLIAKALGTSDTRKAQHDRWQHVAAHKALFDRLRQPRPITAEEMRAEAAAELHNIYEEMRVHGSEGISDYLFAIQDGAGNLDLDSRPMSNETDPLDFQSGSLLRQRALATIQRIGAEPTEDSIRAMSSALADAAFKATEYWERKLEPPAPPKQPRRRTTAEPGLKISQVSEQFLTERQRDDNAKMTAQTAAQMRATFRLFKDHTKDASIGSIDREDAVTFLDTISGLHRHYGRRPGAASLTLSELLRKFPAGEGDGLSNRTLNRHQSALKTLFRWARRKGKISFNENPFADLMLPKARLSEVTWQPFTVDELNKLFKGAEFDTKPKKHSLAVDQPWVMAIALFSGMRQAEICELDAENIRQELDVWYFDITAAKSEAGVRCVPMHSTLISLGLLEYLKAVKSGPLFPGIAPGGPDQKRAHTLAKRFPAYRRDKGVKRERLVFHSFRKCFVSALVRANVEPDKAALVVGHERGFTFRVYDRDKTPLQMLREVVEAVKYEGLSLPSLKAGNRRKRYA